MSAPQTAPWRRQLEAQLAEKEAELEALRMREHVMRGMEVEIKRLKCALDLADMGRQASVPFARYEAVVEAAREWLEDWREPEKRGGKIDLTGEPPAAEKLRAALAALEPQPSYEIGPTISGGQEEIERGFGLPSRRPQR